jgi:uncharacterized metal-binding protein YceD (DUF177 family)
MNYLSKYEIAFKGLKEGVHRFEYELDEKFFDRFESSEVKKGSLNAEVVLTKQSALMIFEFSVKGKVELLCDRCLDFYYQKVSNKSKLFVKYGMEDQELSDDVIVVSQDEYQINTAQYLFELVILGLPIKRVHPVDKNGKSACDPEMIAKLNEYLVEEKEVETEEPVDERWNELKKIINNK